MTLDKLSVSHPDRNRPLAGCKYKWRGANAWKTVTPAYGIARSAFNDLGASWTDHDEFEWEESK